MLKKLFKIENSMPLRAKIVIAVLVLIIFTGGGVVSFKFYDFTQNNPKFCVSCHLMQPAFDSWDQSKHKDINCHECHHLSVPDQNRLLISFVVHKPETVPDRHGKVIVPWSYCIKCHWEKNEKYPNAPMINGSAMHANHYFGSQIECSECHGYMVHKFVPEERFCLRCHQGKTVHGSGMGELACLNCHTDRTKTLLPGPKKCLFCHGDDSIRRELIADNTLDVTHYQPDEATIRNATKINRPADAPMKFFCSTCHKPHIESRPDWSNCLDCHGNIPDVGKHGVHIKTFGMSCKDCHKPHKWRVLPEDARKDCTKCHEYRDPRKFLS